MLKRQVVCIFGMLRGDWRTGESVIVVAKWGGGHYSDSLKPADAQRRHYCLTMKPLQRVKKGGKKIGI